jgi:hypothetical protein
MGEKPQTGFEKLENGMTMGKKPQNAHNFPALSRAYLHGTPIPFRDTGLK